MDGRAPKFSHITAALLCLALVCGASAADVPPATQSADNSLTVGADPSADATRDKIAKWFNRLDDADAGARDEAYNNLCALKSTDLDMLKHVVKDALPLRPAQESALPGIVKQLFLSGAEYDGDANEGFLGISLQDRDAAMQGPGVMPPTPHAGLLVSRCMPGFCGARVLRGGDVILNILERPDVKVDGSSAFALTIRGFNAGQVVHMNVLRDGRVIKVAIALDARPLDLNGDNAEFAMQDMLRHREDAAGEYWSKDFAPLFKSGAS